MPRRDHEPKVLPDRTPSLESIPDHIIHINGDFRNGYHYHPDLARPFRSPYTAPPHQWPTNAECWGLYEAYPSLKMPDPPVDDTIPSMIFHRGGMRQSRDEAYPAFMYKLAGKQFCGRHPTLITEWEIDDNLVATLGACWRCRLNGLGAMRDCGMRGTRIEWRPLGDIPEGSMGASRSKRRKFDNDFINDNPEDEDDGSDESSDDGFEILDHGDGVPDSHGDMDNEDDDEEVVFVKQEYSKKSRQQSAGSQRDDMSSSRQSSSSSSKRRRFIDPDDEDEEDAL